MMGRKNGALGLLIAGFTLWSLAFIMLYALQALGCAYGWSHHRLVLVIAFILSLLPLAWLALRPPDGNAPLSNIALWANRAALGAGVLAFLPVTFASTCL